MLDRVFLLAMEEGPAACGMVTVDEERMKFLQAAPEHMAWLRAWGGAAVVTFFDPDGVKFLNVPDAETLDYETIEALYEGSNVMLGTPLDEGDYEEMPLTGAVLMISDAGVCWGARAKVGGSLLETKLLHWSELGVEVEDNVRCRHLGCAEGHPMAGELELVTCLQCRKEMKL
jgi:hypothetical protein